MSNSTLTPQSEAELADILASAADPVSIAGGGTQAMATGHRVLSTAAMSGVTLYEPGALTLVAQAGTALGDITSQLEAENQRLAFEPRDLRKILGTKGAPTLGAVAAMNNSGPARVTAGACRDFMLGVRFVDGQGNVVSNGGRVMKNVTGYDLVKLMAGSHGTLGVLTEVSLKVLPKPEATGVLLIDGLSDADAVAAMSLALGSPFEVTGAAHAPEGVDGHPVTMIRIEGFDESVSYRLSQLTELLGKFGEVAVETRPERTRAGWQWVRDLEVFEGLEGNLWKLSVKPSDAPILAARLGGAKRLYDWGGGLLWILLDEGTDPRAQMGDIAGHATLVKGSGHPRFHPQTKGVAMLSQGLRQKFDPRGILNPGLMG
ncbi:MAG: FAD-binding protein [Cognatishimia sp.]|uniref:FAD-binding protein n=1 Tax=Cognatishimia sp. TaxID=2211648 RepID=UPI00405937E5